MMSHSAQGSAMKHSLGMDYFWLGAMPSCGERGMRFSAHTVKTLHEMKGKMGEILLLDPLYALSFPLNLCGDASRHGLNPPNIWVEGCILIRDS